MKRKILVPALSVLGAVGLLAPFALSTGTAHSAAANTQQAIDDTRQASQIVQSGVLPIADEPAVVAGTASPAPATSARAAAAVAAAAVLPDPTVDENRDWLALDDVYGRYYPKTFTLYAINDKTEVWVATEAGRRVPAFTALPQVGVTDGTGFINGDCRAGRTTITKAQASYIADQFQNNMLAKENAVFSTAPNRDGSAKIIVDRPGRPPFNPLAPGQRTVVLVDNVRDDNFYDLNNTKGLSFIAGFFSRQLNTLFDRNIMTIDAMDWLHRTTATPPNDPIPGDNCKSAPARPFAYEGVFAHEYQHLLHSYSDPDEATWVNEGLSDWAESLTGYVDPSIPIDKTGFESHTQCILGYLGKLTPANPNPRAGGPENSLTRWTDQTEAEILCDYGAAYTFMNYVHGQYGDKFMTSLHNSPGNGLVAVKEALVAVGDRKTTPQDLVHNWALSIAVDGYLDAGAELESKISARKLQTPALNAIANFDVPDAYSTPGAPSNGSDYVRLRDANGNPLNSRDLKSLKFTGATTLPSAPLAWKSDPNPPTRSGNPALFSGAADDRDESAVTPITVGTGAAAALTFDAFWDEEETWDFGFAQISTDGGKTYKSLACTDTSTVTDPQAVPAVVENVPGFTGASGAFKPQTCDLAAYAGKSVLLAFRSINDPGTLGNSDAPAGFWVDNVKVGATLVSDGSSVAAFKSATQTAPVPVAGFYVSIISVQTKSGEGRGRGRENGRERGREGRGETKVMIKRLPLTADFMIRGDDEVHDYVLENASFVGAVVTYDDPTETIVQYAPYTLTVNGVVQPGGM
jgi:Immune inhibitor A peptidase M6